MKISLEKAEQNWDNSPLVKLIESRIDSDEKVDLFKELVENGASLDVRSTPLNWNLLHYLIMASQMDTEIKKVNSFEKKVIEAIAEKQPSLVDERDSTDYTPIAYAVENKEADIARMLASKGADLNAPIYSVTNQVETLLDIALKNFDKDVLPVLLNQEQEKVYKATDAVFKRIISEKDSEKYKEVLTLLRDENRFGFYKAMHQNKMAIINLAIEKNDFAFLENALVGSDIGPLDYFTKEQFDKAKENKDPNNTIVKKIDEFYSKYQDDENWVNCYQPNFREIIRNKIDEFKLLIEKGGDIISGSYTPLHCAAEWGNVEARKLILEAAGDRKIELLTQADEFGRTPFREAVVHGEPEAIKEILKAVGDRKFELLERTDGYGYTPFLFAARYERTEAIKAILESAEDMKFELLAQADKDGSTPLIWTAFLGTVKAINTIIEAAGDKKFELLTQKDKYGTTPLSVAATRRYTKPMNAIIEAAGDRKFELLSMQDEHGYTLLHKAAKEGNAEAIKAILEAAGDRKFELLSMQDEHGYTPLHYAAEKGKAEMIKLILEAAGDRKFELLTMQDKDVNTPLHKAALLGQTKAIKAILESSGDRKFELLSMQDEHGYTPLHYAAEKGKTEAIKAILEAAGNRKFELLFMQDEHGYTLLHKAAKEGKTEAIKAMLEAAGDRKFELLSMQDEHGNTTAEEGETETIKPTIEAAGDRKIELLSQSNSGFFDFDDKTPMHFFTDKMFEEVSSLQGVNKEVLGAVKSHISYYGVEESFFGNLSRTFNKACAILPALYGEDISANVTFQNEVDSVLDKIRHDLRANSRTNEGIAR